MGQGFSDRKAEILAVGRQDEQRGDGVRGRTICPIESPDPSPLPCPQDIVLYHPWSVILGNPHDEKGPVIRNMFEPFVDKLQQALLLMKPRVEQGDAPFIRDRDDGAPVGPGRCDLFSRWRRYAVGDDADRLTEAQRAQGLELPLAGGVPAVDRFKRTRVDDGPSEGLSLGVMPPRPRVHHSARREHKGRFAPPGRGMGIVQRSEPDRMMVNNVSAHRS